MSAAIAAASAAALASRRQKYNSTSNYNSIFPASNFYYPNSSCLVQPSVGRYESQKRCDWNSFTQYLHNHQSRLFLSRCSGEHVVEFLRYLDQFGKTKVHSENCRPFFGQSDHQYSSPPCACPLRQAWGSVDAIVGRLRVAFEENGGSPDLNPFAARSVRLYLRDVRDTQAKARGVTYEIKKKKMVMT